MLFCDSAGLLRRRATKERSSMISAIAALVRRHPLVTFFVLACAFSWWPWPLYTAGLSPSPIAGFGPFLAAFVVLPFTHGRAGVMTLLRRMVKWHVRLRWYAVALLSPIVVTGTAAVLNVLLGAQPAAAVLAGWPSLFLTFALLLLVPGIGGAWEEPGFRGYAIPNLQAKHSALVASLILGGLHVLWHLPLFLIGNIQWSDVVFVPAWAVVLTWLLNSSGGSVLLLMLTHAMNNTISGGFFSPMFTGADAVRQSWLFAGLWCLVALIVVVVAGSARLSRRAPTFALEAAEADTSAADVPAPGGLSHGPRTVPVV
jgi:membrane protease YdiL (CAAX protease family)